MKYLSAYIIILFTLVGCGKVHCPAFPEELVGYLPYETGGIIRFTNGTDTTAFPITEFEITKAYSFSKQCDCTCESNGYIHTDTSDYFNVSMLCMIIAPFDTTFSFSIYEQYSSTDGKELVYSDRIGSYTDNLSETAYKDVLIFEYPSAKGPISKVIIANGQGIIRLVEKANGTIWYLVEN